MEIKWIIITIVLVCVIALTLYLIKRDQKDKKEMIKSLNKTEEVPEPKRKEKEEN